MDIYSSGYEFKLNNCPQIISIKVDGCLSRRCCSLVVWVQLRGRLRLARFFFMESATVIDFSFKEPECSLHSCDCIKRLFHRYFTKRHDIQRCIEVASLISVDLAAMIHCIDDETAATSMRKCHLPLIRSSKLTNSLRATHILQNGVVSVIKADDTTLTSSATCATINSREGHRSDFSTNKISLVRRRQLCYGRILQQMLP